ncbi:clathrin adaptor complexes medium subunit family protein isoform X3 [Wolffia australiana]
MSSGGDCCSVRAIWILNPQDSVIFSRRFPVVERRWRLTCQGAGNDGSSSQWMLLPSDEELASAFSERRKKEGLSQVFGIRSSQSARGSDSWLDDPITRHLISLPINQNGGKVFQLWPLVLHSKGSFHIIVLPLIQPTHLEAYERICYQSDHGSFIGHGENLSSLLLDLPCITGALLVAHSIGDVITGDFVDPEVVSNSSPSVGGLLDSLTGTIGISGLSARAKPAATPVTSTASASLAVGASAFDPPKNSLRSIDKDALRSFISSSMPFGTPLDLNYSNIATMRATGFPPSDILLTDLKQPAWKPYLYKGKQRILFTFHEIVHAAMYDRDEIPDIISISGQVNCRAELEGLVDVSFPLTGLQTANAEVMSFHPCAQVPEQGMDKHAVMFTPPLGNFTLMNYQAFSGLGPAVKGFYQLSMVSENEGAFLFKLKLMEGYKAPMTMEYCTVCLPFPRRRVVHFDGNPSIGTVSTTEHSIDWKIVPTGRGFTGKMIEATFPGTIRFSPMSRQASNPAFRPMNESLIDDDSDLEQEISSNTINMEEFLMEKMKKEMQPADLGEPFCWQAYNYAKVSFKIVGGTLSGATMDPKSVSIYPSVKAPVDLAMQVHFN